jgi:hypothetical protein
MEVKTAEKILEASAFMSVGLDKLFVELSKIEDLKERKEFSPFVKDFLTGFYNFRDEIGNRHPDLHPDYLGIETYANMQQKFKLPDYLIAPPSQESIEKAIALGIRMKNARDK